MSAQSVSGPSTPLMSDHDRIEAIDKEAEYYKGIPGLCIWRPVLECLFEDEVKKCQEETCGEMNKLSYARFQKRLSPDQFKQVCILTNATCNYAVCATSALTGELFAAWVLSCFGVLCPMGPILLPTAACCCLVPVCQASSNYWHYYCEDDRTQLEDR